MQQPKNNDAVRAAIGKYIKLPPEVLAKMQISPPGPVVTEKQLTYWVDLMKDQDMLKAEPEGGHADRQVSAAPHGSAAAALHFDQRRHPPGRAARSCRRPSFEVAARRVRLRRSAPRAAARPRCCAPPPASCAPSGGERAAPGPAGDAARRARWPSCSRTTAARCCPGARCRATSAWRWRPPACRRPSAPARIAARAAQRWAWRRMRDKFPAQLSGGMQQRVQIARCLAQQPDAAADGRALRRARRDDAREPAGRGGAAGARARA